MSKLNVSPVSKPFVISAIVLLFLGSSIGSIWIMSLYGIQISSEILSVIPLHKILQLDGFFTLLIMGVGYTIVPRFRNILLPHQKLAYFSFLFVISSIGISFFEEFNKNQEMIFLSDIIRLIGISIFVGIILWVIKSPPRLLRKADYFIVMSMLIFLFINSVNLFENQIIANENSLIQIQLWLLFPILMIFGVEFKTLPSFLGFIRPKNKMGNISIFLAAVCCIIAPLSIFIHDQILPIIFNIVLLSLVFSQAYSLYIFGGFDKTEIKNLSKGEKKIRYEFTEILTQLSFVMLFLATSMAILFNLFSNTFSLYDLAIHYTTIGFIGFSIMLYLPVMLPPIVKKTIHFLKFNKIPIILVIISLGFRTIGDFFILDSAFSSTIPELAEYVLALSGWIIVAALFVFVIMIHRSMKNYTSDLEVI